MPFKVSKDLNFSLVSTNNLSETISSNSLGPGPDEVGQKVLKLLHLWCHSQKIRNPKTKKFFFIADAKICPSHLRVWTAL